MAHSADGYVTYKTTVSHNSTTNVFTLNETVSPTNQAGLSSLTVQLLSNDRNLSYSRIVNSSMNFFPYLPALNNQSLSYGSQGFAVHLNLSKVGTSSTSFGGKPYQLTNYLLNVSATSMASKVSANGELKTAPSGLIYSLFLQLNQTSSIQLQLTATNLSLDYPPASNDPSVLTAVGLGAVAAAAAAVGVAVTLRMKRAKKADSNVGGGNKPPHWVD
jgi:hypothetical protein